jgi:hypothetical protein
MSDFPKFFRQAEPMLEAAGPGMRERSDEYRAGYHYGLAYVLAGKEWQWRSDVPHGTGYAERDAWLAGFEHGIEHADNGERRLAHLGLWL